MSFCVSLINTVPCAAQIAYIGRIPERPTVIQFADTFNFDVKGSKQGCTEVPYEWRFYSASDGFRTINQTYRVGSDVSKWILPKRFLNISLYVVVLVNEKFKQSDFGFLRIVTSPLVALIDGGKDVTRGYRLTINLDASPSYHKDTGPGHYGGMTFTWYCKKLTETFYKKGGLPLIDIPQQRGAGGGCFGTGVGRLAATERVVKLDTGLLVIGETFVIRLTVRKGHLVATYDQSITIDKGSPPHLAMR